MFMCVLKCLCMFVCVCPRVTQDDGDTASMAPHPDDMEGPQGASSTLSLPMSQGKPSLRRIKGRIHRSKSLDSMDLLDSVSPPTSHPPKDPTLTGNNQSPADTSH